MSADIDNDKTFNRIDTILAYIHENMDSPLSVEILAEMSCWSRWQLQRVFLSHTGMNVAQYVRELRLSMAAIEVLNKKYRMLDIAYLYGFTSEIAFSRSFKQYFKMSPREYQKQGKKIGIRKPFLKSQSLTEIQGSGFYQVRLEYKESFTLTGLPITLQGLFSDAPDFLDKVPQVWEELDGYLSQVSSFPESKYGVIDTRNDTESLIYWAGVIEDESLSSVLMSLSENVLQVIIPSQEYAVLPYIGPSSGLAKSVEWLISEWLPFSGHQGIEGFDLEIYHLNENEEIIDVEYWLPIRNL